MMMVMMMMMMMMMVMMKVMMMMMMMMMVIHLIKEDEVDRGVFGVDEEVVGLGEGAVDPPQHPLAHHGHSVDG